MQYAKQCFSCFANEGVLGHIILITQIINLLLLLIILFYYIIIYFFYLFYWHIYEKSIKEQNSLGIFFILGSSSPVFYLQHNPPATEALIQFEWEKEEVSNEAAMALIFCCTILEWERKRHNLDLGCKFEGLR